jgi:acyl-CoA synthetase (AMP-forming)/AMP-acid ligase II
MITFADLATRIGVLNERWRSLAGLRVGIALRDPVDHVAVAAALDGLGCHAFLAGGRNSAEIRALADQLHWDAVVWNLMDEPEEMNAPPAGNSVRLSPKGVVTVLTSGTTGRPKAANHTWTTLAGPVRRDRRYAAARWLCAYPLTLYAGTQVMLQALLNWSALVIPPSLDPGTVSRTMRTARVTHASGTPTFWRQVALFGPREDLRECRLEQITMGGETVLQPLLDQLAGLFPQARLVHIYASTELGRLFSVTDGREGFPAEFLEESPEPGIELKIVDGELMARSRHAMLEYDRLTAGGFGKSTDEAAGGWVATGDLVECRGDRVLFRGRKSDLINVGGRKVSPMTVETVLREAAGVGDVRVYGKGSSLAGQLVAADIVLAEGSNEHDVRMEINRIVRGRLAQHEIPRLVQVVESIAQNAAMKIVRSGAA